jgi:hypothetical protein
MPTWNRRHFLQMTGGLAGIGLAAHAGLAEEQDGTASVPASQAEAAATTASYRVTGTCMAMGQAAGLAAAMAAAEGESSEKLDGRAVRAALEQRGAGFLG